MYGVPHEKFCKLLSSPEELVDILHQQGSVSARIWLPIHSDNEYTSHFTGTEHCIYTHSYIANWVNQRRAHEIKAPHTHWQEIWSDYINETMWFDICGHKLYVNTGDVYLYIPYTWKSEDISPEDLAYHGICKGIFTRYQAGEKVLIQGQRVQIMGKFILQPDGTISIGKDINCPSAISLKEQITFQHSTELERKTRNVAKTGKRVMLAIIAFFVLFIIGACALSMLFR